MDLGGMESMQVVVVVVVAEAEKTKTFRIAGFPAQKLSRRQKKCVNYNLRQIHKYYTEGFQTILKDSTVFGLSGQFPHCLDSFRTVWTVYRLSGNFPDSTETYKTLQTVSRLSSWLPDYQEGLKGFHTF